MLFIMPLFRLMKLLWLAFIKIWDVAQSATLHGLRLRAHRVIKLPQHPSAFSVTVLTVLAVAGETLHAPSPHIDWIPSAQLRRYFDSVHLLIDACYNSAEVPWLKFLVWSSHSSMFEGVNHIQ